jgi:hypothetical protein
MPDHQPDRRSLNFAGDVDEYGHPLPMTVAILRGRTERWPLSCKTPDGVADHLARSRQMFVSTHTRTSSTRSPRVSRLLKPLGEFASRPETRLASMPHQACPR